MKRFPIEFLSIATALIIHPAFAQADAKLIWSNAKGVIPAADCKVDSSSEASMRISQHVTAGVEHAENLRTLKGKSSIEVIDGSLVKIIPAAKDIGRKYVQVVSGLTPAKILSVGEHAAARLNEGYLPDESLKDIGDYVLELKAGAPVVALDKKHSKIRGTFWQAAIKDNNYVVYNCGQGPAKKVYLAFDVYVREIMTPVARIGVNLDETQVFRSIQTYTADQAEKKIAASAAASGKPSGAKPPVSISQKPVAVATPKPTPTPQATPKPTPMPTPKPVSSVAAKVATAVAATKPPSTDPKPTLPKPTPSPTPAPTPSPSPTPPGPDQKPTAASQAKPDVPVIQGDLESVICIAEGTAQVHDQSLKKVLFTAKKNAEVKPMQTFGNDKQIKMIYGKTYTFIKAMFPEQHGSQKIGWISSDLVKPKSQCATAPQQKPITVDKNDETPSSSTMTITGLGDKNCCEFPLTGRPTTSYKSGMRRFGAGRGGGTRIHAACDLYRDDGDKVIAVAPGQVILPKYYFYQGVYAIEVRHTGGFVVRYGEVLGDDAPGIRMGAKVEVGQTVGYVGTVNSGCCSPMLHFEMYSGSESGSLTQKYSEGYQRREDLMDPTAYLSKWEQKKFGESF
jgi:murein DD-endopeptidase MepM/ murein hydrolase activator NlpD